MCIKSFSTDNVKPPKLITRRVAPHGYLEAVGKFDADAPITDTRPVRALSGFDLIPKPRRGRRPYRRLSLLRRFLDSAQLFIRLKAEAGESPDPHTAASVTLCLNCGDVRVLFPCEDYTFMRYHSRYRRRGLAACKPEDLVIHWQPHPPLRPWCYVKRGCQVR